MDVDSVEVVELRLVVLVVSDSIVVVVVDGIIVERRLVVLFVSASSPSASLDPHPCRQTAAEPKATKTPTRSILYGGLVNYMQ